MSHSSAVTSGWSQSWVACVGLWIASSTIVWGQTDSAVNGNHVSKKLSASLPDNALPYNQNPINYSDGAYAVDEPVARLMAELDDGSCELKFTAQWGYLPDLLEKFGVSPYSQLLVFSKTSLQQALITPSTPRAIYFNDDVYIGWIPESKRLEISSVDARKGGLFFTLEQAREKPPRFHREAQCLTCHVSSNSLGVPGHLARSFVTNPQGEMISGWSRVHSATPYKNRWGGWYLLPEYQSDKHLGNRLVDLSMAQEPGLTRPAEFSPKFPLEKYLVPESNLVPHLVLLHQAHGHNLITRLNYEARLKRPLATLEPLVRYLVSADEPPLPAPVPAEMGANYRQWFEAQGPRDSGGRSLRQFELRTRTFRYQLSYLVQTAAFRAIPGEAREQVWKRLHEVLFATEPLEAFPTIAPEEQQALREIVRETIRPVPKSW